MLPHHTPIFRDIYSKKTGGTANRSKKPHSDEEAISKPMVIKPDRPGVPTFVLNELKGLKDSMSSVVAAMSCFIDQLERNVNTDLRTDTTKADVGTATISAADLSDTEHTTADVGVMTDTKSCDQGTSCTGMLDLDDQFEEPLRESRITTIFWVQDSSPNWKSDDAVFI